MRRDSGAKEEALQFYRRKLEEATAADAMERLRIGNVIVIQAAVDLLQPVGLRKTLLFSLAAMASLLAAIVWVCLLELLDHRIYKAEELEAHVGVPVFAAIPSGRLPRVTGVPFSESHAAKA
jgi:capsular polysaccharide biosynthesis protein